MGDYFSKTTRPGAGGLGEPGLVVRNDTPGDLSGANGAYAESQVDSAGALRVTNEGGKKTYRGVSQFACDSTATDIAALAGNGITTVKVLWVKVSSRATAAAIGDLSLVRRSAADTAGTAVNASVGQLDGRDAANQSTPQHYTAHPTSLGTAVATVDATSHLQGTAAVVGDSTFFDFRSENGEKGGLRLSGATDLLCLNAAAALGGSGNAWDVVWCWTEEPTTA